MVIDTEQPKVHFSDYDNIFDQNSEQVGSFAYNPKDINDTPQLRIIEHDETALNIDKLDLNLEASGIIETDEILE